MSEQGAAGQVVPGRSAPQVAYAVWRALFLREASARFSVGRAAWVWVVLEPVLHVALMMAIFSYMRDSSLPGVDFALFLAVAVLGYHMFKNPAQRSIGAIEANQSMLTYRQVRPVDMVLVRCFLEGVLQLVVIFLLLTGVRIAGFEVTLVDPMGFLQWLLLLWLFGCGVGLALSAGSRLVPEIGRVATLLFMPLYLCSGVFYRPEMAPPDVRAWLLMNPLVHGVEGLRATVFPAYHVLQEISMGYLAFSAVVALFFGLAIQLRLARRLAAR